MQEEYKQDMLKAIDYQLKELAKLRIEILKAKVRNGECSRTWLFYLRSRGECIGYGLANMFTNIKAKYDFKV